MGLDKSINHYGFIYFHGSKNIYFHWTDIFIALVKAMVLPVVMYGCAATAAAKSLQSRPTLCDPIDCSPPGSPVPWILQARTLEWVAISFSNAWK